MNLTITLEAFLWFAGISGVCHLLAITGLLNLSNDKARLESANNVLKHQNHDISDLEDRVTELEGLH